MKVLEYDADVCVIGGGPAGSVIAKQLAELEYKVLLVEKAVFPRAHVGICLSEPTNALLDYLGVSQEINKANFWKRKQTLVRWDADKPLMVNQPGMHVARGQFDKILLNAAVDSGVKAFQSMRATSIVPNPNGGWQIEVDSKSKTLSVHAKFLVDASGRTNILRGKNIRYAPPLFALHANWELRSEPTCDGVMEAGDSSWLWVAYLGKKRAMISLYTDPKHVATSDKSIEEYYLTALAQFTELKSFDRISVLGKIMGCDASSRYSPDPVGKDFIRVGDACLSVDPMASQGVHLAMSSGIQATVVVNTLIRHPKNTELAQSFYRNSQKSRIDQFRIRTASEYSRAAIHWPGKFWQERAQHDIPATQETDDIVPAFDMTQEVQLCSRTKILPTPVLQENLVTSALALHHPSLNQPVAFLDGIFIPPLLQILESNPTVLHVLSSWKVCISDELALQILQWLWQRKILISFKQTI